MIKKTFIALPLLLLCLKVQAKDLMKLNGLSGHFDIYGTSPTTANTVVPTSLQAIDSPADGEVPSKAAGVDKFEWIAAGGGSGDTVLAATQTFSGGNTFSSWSVFSGSITATNASNTLGGVGTALTALNASNLASGTVGDSRLSSNVLLTTSSPTVTGSYTFNNVILSSTTGVPTATSQLGFKMSPPGAETIGAGGTITANVCGGFKYISSAGSVTTDTTNTFTAPSATNNGCWFILMNVGANNIVLDNNALFATVGAANITMTPNDIVFIGSNGSVWGQLTTLIAL